MEMGQPSAAKAVGVFELLRSPIATRSCRCWRVLTAGGAPVASARSSARMERGGRRSSKYCPVCFRQPAARSRSTASRSILGFVAHRSPIGRLSCAPGACVDGRAHRRRDDVRRTASEQWLRAVPSPRLGGSTAPRPAARRLRVRASSMHKPAGTGRRKWTPFPYWR